MARRNGSGVEVRRPSAGIRAEAASGEAAGTAMSREQLVEFYRLMYLSRRTDDREIVLKRQQKIFFQISCAGHEALLVAAGLAMRPGYDWFFPYYRDRAICLALGNTVEEQLLQALGAADDPASGGRQMPSHWSSRKLHIVTPSSATATQCLHAIGCAEAGRYYSRHPHAAGKPEAGSVAALRNDRQLDYRAFKQVEFHGDEVVYVSLGELTVSAQSAPNADDANKAAMEVKPRNIFLLKIDLRIKCWVIIPTVLICCRFRNVRKANQH